MTDVSAAAAEVTSAFPRGPEPAEADVPDQDETRLAAGGGTASRTRPDGMAGGDTGPLHVGQNFGTRYHIIRALGTGGMGAVYQAWDQELEGAVAVKVIRPDVTADARTAQELERRFKRELVLARQVTHKNVVRIHDIGEIDGIKYITMPYVQGDDLATILKREGRVAVPRAVAIARQVAAGLVAAHEAGVVHRDLKPANIMIDADDQAMIMDFGIARSTSGGSGLAMTVAGAVIGTVEYMAPEQATGGLVDQRADIYAFGLILRDMLLGGRRVGATTAVAELMARMQQPPPPIAAIDPTIPAPLDALVTRCLQPVPAARFQSAADLLRQLEAFGEGRGTAVTSVAPAVAPALPARLRRLAPIAGLIVLLGLGAFALRSWTGRAPAADAPAAASAPVVSLAVLPFRNASGDPSLDSLGVSLSEVLATDLGEAAQIRPIASERVHQVLGDLRIDPGTSLRPSDLSRIADFTSAQTILWGQYVKFGDEIRIDATLQDLSRQRSTALKATALNQAGLLTAVTELAASVQQALAEGSVGVLRELRATAWRPSTQSFDALRDYNDGLQFARDGNQQAALKQFQAAVGADNSFALAYSALGRTYAALGYDAEALQNSRRAVELSAALPAQERLLIAAAHHRIANERDQAIATYEELLGISPNNPRLHFEVASLYEEVGNLAKAREHFATAVTLDPKFVEGLIAVGRVEIRSGEPQASIEPLNNALSLAIQLDNDEARANALQAIGVAYKRLGRPAEALKQYEESLAIKRRIGQKRGMAVSLLEIAQIQEMLGQPQAALKSYHEALGLYRGIGDKSGTAQTQLNLGALLNETLGRPAEALPPLREALSIARDEGNRAREALALNNIGAAYLASGEYSEAQTYFERALELREAGGAPREVGDTLHNLGETLSRMGKFDQALTRYLRALDLRRQAGDRRGEAIESYSIGTIFDYQGRYGAAVQSKGDALAAYRQVGQRDFWLGEILSGYGSSLAAAGRLAEAKTSLDESLALARELKNDALESQVQRFSATRLWYAGAAAEAAARAEVAAQTAARASDQSLDLWARTVVAQTAAAVTPGAGQAAALRTIGRDAGARGLTYLSILADLESAVVDLRIGQAAAARQSVERTLARAEALGLRELVARAEYVLATTLRLAKNGQARQHYAAARRVLDEMRRESGQEHLLERADLKAIAAEADRWSTSGEQ